VATSRRGVVRRNVVRQNVVRRNVDVDVSAVRGVNVLRPVSNLKTFFCYVIQDLV
jgi:hypothetical protein